VCRAWRSSSDVSACAFVGEKEKCDLELKVHQHIDANQRNAIFTVT